MIKLIIQRKNYEKIKHEERFLDVIILSRLVNNLRANQRCWTRAINDKSVASEKDLIDYMLYHGAILYEAIKTFSDIQFKFRDLSEYKKQQNEIKKIARLYGDKKSFRNTVLDIIRNKLMFHFEPEIIKEGIDHYDLGEDFIFARGESSKNIDLVYTLSDDLAINYLLCNIDMKMSDEDKYKHFGDEILRISKMFCRVVELLIGESIQDNIDYVEEE